MHRTYLQPAVKDVPLWGFRAIAPPPVCVLHTPEQSKEQENVARSYALLPEVA